jgi:hypothetical protein
MLELQNTPSKKPKLIDNKIFNKLLTITPIQSTLTAPKID